MVSSLHGTASTYGLEQFLASLLLARPIATGMSHLTLDSEFFVLNQ